MSQSNIYVGVAGNVGRPDAVGAVGVFRRSTGDGAWQHVFDSHETHSVFIHPSDPSLVFAGTTDGVWRSDDHGASFQRARFPDPNTQIWSFLAIDDEPDRMYAGASPVAVYRSDDRGLSWRKLPDPVIAERCAGPFSPRVMRMAQRPGHANEIYAALEIAGAMRTTDGGETWERFDKVQVHGTIMSVGLHTSDPDQVYIGARYDGEIFGTRDGGATWHAMPLPGPVKDIYSVACG